LVLGPVGDAAGLGWRDEVLRLRRQGEDVAGRPRLREPARRMNGRGPALNRDFLTGPDGWPYLLVPFIPLAIALDIAGASAGMIFFAAAIGIIPTAALMGRATEELAERSGPGIGGLLNVTFGNAPELIIALFAVEKGRHEVVKASLIGSILGNVLLVLGASMFFGGLKNTREGGSQEVQRTAADRHYYKRE